MWANVELETKQKVIVYRAKPFSDRKKCREILFYMSFHLSRRHPKRNYRSRRCKQVDHPAGPFFLLWLQHGQ